MEGKKENMASEIGADYNVALRSDAPPPVSTSPLEMTPTSSGMGGIMEKKKRGRPRKYGPGGSAGALSPMAIVSADSPSAVAYSSGKRGKGRSSNSETKHGDRDRVEMKDAGKGVAPCDGVHFTPHVITINAGEDVTAKIISFCQQGPRAICILSANGTLSNATLRQSDSSGGTLTYEGRFEIVNLCGSFTPTESEGTRYRSGGLSISLSSPNGQVVGGCVAGLLVAAGPVQIIVGSFLPSSQPEHKPKKHKSRPASQSTTPVPALPAPADNDDARNNQGHPIPQPSAQTVTPIPFARDAWPVAHSHSMHDARNSADIKISLPGGMH